MVLQCGATDRGLVEALAGFGIDIEPGGQEALVKCFARAHHDAMFTQRHRLLIAIAGHMMDRQQRHGENS